VTIHPPPRVKLTYQDYLAFPADGLRHEIVAGEHHVSASPLAYHQHVVAKIFLQLETAIGMTGKGVVFFAPLTVRLSDYDVVEPDILVFLRDRMDRWPQAEIRSAPNLVVEVLSPSTRSYDQGVKKDCYARHGVAEYWIADPETRSVEQWVLQLGHYELAAVCTDRITPVCVPDVLVDLELAWRTPLPPAAD
jgi:Uma2 family endonuclease